MSSSGTSCRCRKADTAVATICCVLQRLIIACIIETDTVWHAMHIFGNLMAWCDALRLGRRHRDPFHSAVWLMDSLRLSAFFFLFCT